MTNKGRRTSWIQFLKFNAVGLVNTAVDFAVFTILHAAGVGQGIAQVLSYSAGMANSYALNRRITFKGQAAGTGGRRQLFRFIVLNLSVLGLSVILMYGMTSNGVPVLLAKVLVTGVTMVVNFIGSRLWVFRADSGTGQKDA